MWTSELIHQKASELGFKPLATKLELKHLHNVLLAGEPLIAIFEGSLKKIHNRDFNGVGVVILSDKRVIFFRKSMIGTTTTEEIPLSKISSVSARKGVFGSDLHIYTSNNESQIHTPDKSRCEQFCQTLQKMLHTTPETSTPNSNGSDQVSQLEKLFALKEKGAITDDEYSTQKMKILNS